MSQERVVAVLVSGHVRNRAQLDELCLALSADGACTAQGFSMGDGIGLVAEYVGWLHDRYPIDARPPSGRPDPLRRTIEVCERRRIAHVVRLHDGERPSLRWTDRDTGEIFRIDGTIDNPVLGLDAAEVMATFDDEGAGQALREWIAAVRNAVLDATRPIRLDGETIASLRGVPA